MSSITKDLPYPYKYAHWLCVLLRAKSMAYEDRLEAAKQCLAEGKTHGIVNLLGLKKPLDTKGFTYRYDTKLARVIRDTIPKVEIEEIPKPKAPPKPIEIPAKKKVVIIDTGSSFIIKGDWDVIRAFEQTARIGVFTKEGLEIPYRTMAIARGLKKRHEIEKFKQDLISYIRGNMKAVQARFSIKGIKVEVEEAIPPPPREAAIELIKLEEVITELLRERARELLENEYSKEFIEDIIYRLARNPSLYFAIESEIPEKITRQELKEKIKQYDDKIIELAIADLLTLPSDFIKVRELGLTPYSIDQIKGTLRKYRESRDWLSASKFYLNYVYKPYKTYKEIIDIINKLRDLKPITKEEAEKIVQTLREYPKLKETNYIKEIINKIRGLPDEEFRALEVSPYYIIFQELGIYEIAGRAPHYRIQTDGYILHNLLGILKDFVFSCLIPVKETIVTGTTDTYLEAELLDTYVIDASNIHNIAFELYTGDLFSIFNAIRPKEDQYVELFFDGFREKLTIRYDGREHETHTHVEDIERITKMPERFKGFTPNFKITLAPIELEKAIKNVSRYANRGVIITKTTPYGEEVYLVDARGYYREVLSPLEIEARGEQKWVSIDLRTLSKLFPYLRRIADVCTIEADTEKGIYRLTASSAKFNMTLYDVSPYIEKVPEITEREEVFEATWVKGITEMISMFRGTTYANVAPYELQLYHYLSYGMVLILRVIGDRSGLIEEDLYLTGDIAKAKVKKSDTIRLMREKEEYRLYTGNNELLGTFYEGKGDFNVNQIREMVEGDLILSIDPDLLLNIIRNIEVTRTSGLMVVKEDGVYAKAGFEEEITYELELPESAEILIHVAEPKIIPLFFETFSDLKKLCQIAKKIKQYIGIKYRKSLEGFVIIFDVPSDKDANLYVVLPCKNEDVEDLKNMYKEWLERQGV